MAVYRDAWGIWTDQNNTKEAVRRLYSTDPKPDGIFTVSPYTCVEGKDYFMWDLVLPLSKGGESIENYITLICGLDRSIPAGKYYPCIITKNSEQFLWMPLFITTEFQGILVQEASECMEWITQTLVLEIGEHGHKRIPGRIEVPEGKYCCLFDIKRAVSLSKDCTNLRIKEMIDTYKILNTCTEPDELVHTADTHKPICLDYLSPVKSKALSYLYYKDTKKECTNAKAVSTAALPSRFHFSCELAQKFFSGGECREKSDCFYFKELISIKKQECSLPLLMLKDSPLLYSKEQKKLLSYSIKKLKRLSLPPDGRYTAHGMLDRKRKIFLIKQCSLDSSFYTGFDAKMHKEYIMHLSSLPDETRFNKIIKDVASLVRITGRDPLIASILLTLFSIDRLYDPVQKVHCSGKIQCCVIGDTGTGKTTTTERILKGLGIGSIINSTWTSPNVLIDSKLPYLEPDVIVLDEADHWPFRHWELFRPFRDHKEESSIRLIALCNVKRNKSIDDFACGAESMKQLFSPPDIRRFDLAVFLSHTDMEPGTILEEDYPVLPDTNISMPLLRNALLCSRNKFTHCTAATVDYALELLKNEIIPTLYYEEVPLVTMTDMHQKLFRISHAIALMLDCNPAHICVVTEKHIDLAKELLCYLYNSHACGLSIGRLQKNKGRFKFADYRKGKDVLDKLYGHNSSMLQSVHRFMCSSAQFSHRDYMAELRMDEVKASKELRELHQNGLLIFNNDGRFSPTDHFRKILSKMLYTNT